MGPADFQSAGLYHPDAPHAADRLALLEWLVELGCTLEQLVVAQREDRLIQLAGDVALTRGKTLTVRAAAERSGMTPDRVERILLANGLMPTAPDAPVFAEEDLIGLEAFAVGATMFGEEPTGRFARVLGSSLARIAEAAVSLFNVTVEAPLRDGQHGELERAQVNMSAIEALERIPQAMHGLFRLHAETAIRRSRQARAGLSGHGPQLAVGFVDLVGFTTVSRRLEPHDLAALIERFEDTAHEVATQRDGRIVKLIGDEVMFVTVDPAAACDIALTLVERFASDTWVTPRGGLAWGEMLARGGDYYGPIVNLAARIAELAVPNEMLVTPEVAERAQGPGLRFEPAGKRMPKGFDAPVALRTVERATR